MKKACNPILLRSLSVPVPTGSGQDVSLRLTKKRRHFITKPLNITLIDQLNISSGPRVSFALFPNINTPVGRLKYARRVNKRLERIVADADAVIIRAVSDMGWLAFKHALRMNKPIALEMAACAWDSTWNHGNKLGKIYAPIRYLHDRIIARHADFVMYVSYVFLQRRYPTNGEVAHISNVRIDRRVYGPCAGAS